MMKPAVEKKRNGNDKRPKTVPRLQRVIVAAARRSALTLSQSIKSARRSFFFEQQRYPLLTAGTAVFNPPLCADTLCIIRRIMTAITDYFTNSHVNSMPMDNIKQPVAGKLTSIHNNRSIYLKTIVPKTQAELM